MAWPEGKLEFQRGLVDASNSPLPWPSSGRLAVGNGFERELHHADVGQRFKRKQARFPKVVAAVRRAGKVEPGGDGQQRVWFSQVRTIRSHGG